MNFIITEIIGAFAYLTIAFSFFKKHKKQILFAQIIAYILFSIHYYLLDGITGTVCNLLGLVALVAIYLFDKYELKSKKYLIIGIIPIVVIISLLTFKDIYSIFPIIASVLTIGSFLTSKEETIRGIGIVSTICWLVYAVTLHSIVSTVFEIITLIFVLTAFVKYEKHKNENNN